MPPAPCSGMGRLGRLGRLGRKGKLGKLGRLGRLAHSHFGSSSPSPSLYFSIRVHRPLDFEKKQKSEL